MPAVKPAPATNVVIASNAAAQAAENAVRLAGGGDPANRASDANSNSNGNNGDDLQQIAGIGPVVATQLNALGVSRFSDIAMWSPEDVARISATLAINGRIGREDWVGQARALVANQAIEMDGEA